MPRRVKDYIEISDYTSLDKLIDYLKTIRDNLPDGAEPELKVRGDDVFGRRLTISYFRQLTDEENALDARYAQPASPADDAAIEALRKRLDSIA